MFPDLERFHHDKFVMLATALKQTQILENWERLGTKGNVCKRQGRINDKKNDGGRHREW